MSKNGALVVGFNSIIFRDSTPERGIVGTWSWLSRVKACTMATEEKCGVSLNVPSGYSVKA